MTYDIPDRYEQLVRYCGCACLNGANARSIRHNADCARPECLADSP